MKSNKAPVFDIFRGFPGKDAVWVERASGLAAARERMVEIAAQESGAYFVFSPTDHTVLARHIASPTAAIRHGYSVFRKLSDGRALKIGWRRELDEAMQLAAHLMETWPAQYFIQPGNSDEGSDEEASIA